MNRKASSPLLNTQGDGHKKIAVALSGGVDSAVAALLLCEGGYDVEGVTMLLGFSSADPDGAKRLDSRDVEDAKKICARLGIGHRVVDFRKEMENEVIEPFISEYLRGRTPNPCVVCNRRLKFGLLLDKVLSWGFDGLATGHYAALERKDGRFRLKKPADRRKDQTYFLYSLPKERLPLLTFPLAGYTKEEVRDLAVRAGFSLSDKKESQDVCFIPRGGCEAFLRGRGTKMEEGDIINEAGKVLGWHRGIGCYTIGQRGGMGISAPEPLYVLKIDALNNRLIAGKKGGLKAGGLIAGEVNWLVDAIPGEARAKIRYGHREEKCRIFPHENGAIEVRFAEEQLAISPGQSIVFYDDSTVLGGGVIKEVLNGNI
jgi:tRNA-specific 2-thiouridylase